MTTPEQQIRQAFEAVLTCHRFGIFVPLGLAHDLSILLSGTRSGLIHRTDSLALFSNIGLRAIRSLSWGNRTDAAFIAMLCRGLGGEEWRPPAAIRQSELRVSLMRLAASTDAMKATPLCDSFRAVAQRAIGITESFIATLKQIGELAVISDPSIPYRVSDFLSSMGKPDPSAEQARYSPANANQLSLTRRPHVHDAEFAGITNSGRLPEILASQFALPSEIQDYKLATHSLLYRRRAEQRQTPVRPTVVLLDTSPPTFGMVGCITRPAAHFVISSLIARQVPVSLITSNDDVCSVTQCNSDNYIQTVWGSWSYTLPDEIRTLKHARDVALSMRTGEYAPRILVLTHSYFGAEAKLSFDRSLRAFIVRVGKSDQSKPALEYACDAHVCVDPINGANPSELALGVAKLLY